MLALAGIWLAGQLLDLLDGIAARWAGSDGAMGTQLDSIADAVSSGVTPAVVGVMCLHAWAPAIPVAFKFFPLTMAMAATWRLARFNVEAAAGEHANGFSGMPAPAGALWWIGILLAGAQYEMFGSWGLYGTGGLVTVAGAIAIGSTLIPWWMVSRRPHVGFERVGQKHGFRPKTRAVFDKHGGIVGLRGAFFGRALGLGLLAALLLYAMGGCYIQRHAKQPLSTMTFRAAIDIMPLPALVGSPRKGGFQQHAQHRTGQHWQCAHRQTHHVGSGSGESS